MLKFYFISPKHITAVLASLLVSGCQLVKVQENQIGATLASHLDSILTTPQLSTESANLLFLSKQNQNQCLKDVEQCIQQINKNEYIDRAQLYSAASELYLAASKNLALNSSCKQSLTPSSHTQKNRNNSPQQQHCLAQERDLLDRSIRYSYLYLFRTEDRPQSRLFSVRQAQVRSFYNFALSRFMSLSHLATNFTQMPYSLSVEQGRYEIDFRHFPILKGMQIEQFKSSYNLQFSGLDTINRRDGFGAEFVIVRQSKTVNPTQDFVFDPASYYQYPQDWNIYPAKYLPVTVVAEPLDLEAKDLLSTPFVIRFYDPYQYETATVEGQEYQLSGNFSVPYGLWLSDNQFAKKGFQKVLNMGHGSAMPHLFMLEPYDPEKKVIVFIHGLASSPEAWVKLTNNIMGDNVLRKNYQVWQVFYSTNMPIWESRYQIHALLKQAFQQIDQDSVSANNAVLIGHSMGGIISRLLVSDANVRAAALPHLSDEERVFLYRNPSIMDRFEMNSLPQFGRAVFIAAPHRGTEYADRWLTRNIRKMIHLPQSIFEPLTGDPDAPRKSKSIQFGVATVGPNDLSEQSIFMQLTQGIQPNQRIRFHSIMGNSTKTQNRELMSDGIVPYASSYLQGAQSEKIISGGHSIQDTPEAVYELQRILRLHLEQNSPNPKN